MGGMGGMGGLGGMGMGMMGNAGMMGGLGLMGMGGGPANDAMFSAALTSASSQASSQLQLLMPSELLQKSLIPNGHLAEIAQKCRIQLDLGADVAPNQRQVCLSGTIAANAMAAYFLQERSMQYGGMSGTSFRVS